MSSTKIEGLCARHAVITDACRAKHGDDGALDVAVSRLREAYADALAGWRDRPGLKIHLVLTVERPKESTG